jgi:hypothetical protein
MRHGLVVCALAIGCSSAPPAPGAPTVREVGSIPNPPGAGGRDGGFSVAFGGHSVFLFGDTFFAKAAADGYQWRASTWSFTDDTNASDGLDGWTHMLGSDGAPLQLIPHTADEQAFDDAHNGSPCPAGSDCGARHTAWPGPAVVAPDGTSALVFYSREDTESTGSFAFTGTGTSIATWAAPDVAAVRAPLVEGSASDGSVLFAAAEPPFAAAAHVTDGDIYAYSCAGGGLSSPCIVGRVPFGGALDRGQWQFFDGKSWTTDLSKAAHVMDGAPIMSVHYSAHLGAYVEFFMGPLDGTFHMRTAPAPEGPWSAAVDFGQGAAPAGGSFDYGLVAHPELAREGGRVEYASYFQPGSFLDGTMHLVEITYAK